MMMKAETANKVEALRNYLNEHNLDWEELSKLLRNNDNFPSITTLRKYDLLETKFIDKWETEISCEEMADLCDCYDTTANDYSYDEERDLYVCEYVVRYLKIK